MSPVSVARPRTSGQPCCVRSARGNRARLVTNQDGGAVSAAKRSLRGSGMTLSTEMLYLLAAKAGDIKTVRKWARGGADREKMKPRCRERCDRAAAELGIEDPAR